MSTMLIRNAKGKNIKGCFQFDYNGYVISASNTLGEEVTIHKPLTYEPSIPAKNISEAIKMINEFNSIWLY